MNIKKIINFCKQSNIMIFYEGYSEQWISDSCAIYPLFNFDELPNYIIFKDIADNDNILIPYDLTITFDAVQLIPIKTSKGLKFINSKYLSVFNNTELLMSPPMIKCKKRAEKKCRYMARKMIKYTQRKRSVF